MGRPRVSTVALAIAGIAVVALAAFVIARWSPRVPANAASDPVARTVLTGAIAPDATDGSDGSDIPRSPFGQECLPRITNDSGYFDACWSAYRWPFDADPQKDYYVLQLYGTVGPEAGGSPRWAVFKAHLAGEPRDAVLSTWPEGSYNGPCTQMPVSLQPDIPDLMDTLCGRTTTREDASWTRVVTWTCEGCLLPSNASRALSLYEVVGVPEGTVPSWDVYADIGS